MMDLLLSWVARWNQMSPMLRWLVGGFVLLMGVVSLSVVLIYRPYMLIQKSNEELKQVQEQWWVVKRIADEATNLSKSVKNQSAHINKGPIDVEKAVQATASNLAAEDVEVKLITAGRVNVKFTQVDAKSFKLWLREIRMNISAQIDQVTLQPTEQGLQGNVLVVVPSAY